MTTETIDYEKLAEAIAAKIRPTVPLDLEVWTAADIALYLKVTLRQVLERYAPLTDFPRAIRLPTPEGHRGHPRWMATEVIAWAKKHQDKKRAAA